MVSIFVLSCIIFTPWDCSWGGQVLFKNGIYSVGFRVASRPSTPRVIEMLGRSGSALRQGFRLRRKRLYAAGAVARWRSRDLPASIVSVNHKKDAPLCGASFLGSAPLCGAPPQWRLKCSGQMRGICPFNIHAGIPPIPRKINKSGKCR